MKQKHDKLHFAFISNGLLVYDINKKNSKSKKFDIFINFLYQVCKLSKICFNLNYKLFLILDKIF